MTTESQLQIDNQVLPASATPTSLFIASPLWGGTCHGHFAWSLLDLQRLCIQLRIGYEFRSIHNAGIVTHARNHLAARFLESKCTHLLFADADLKFRAGDVVQMLAADKEIIGAAYAKKQIMWDKALEAARTGRATTPGELEAAAMEPAYLTTLSDADSDNPSLVVEIDYIGTGLMLIKREVFEKIAASQPENVYDDSIFLDKRPGESARPDHNFFEFRMKPGMFLSEDYDFCRKWKELGGKVFLYTGAETSHFGGYEYKYTHRSPS